MNNKQVKNRIEKILLQDDRLRNKEKTEPNQTLLLDLAEKIDEKYKPQNFVLNSMVCCKLIV